MRMKKLAVGEAGPNFSGCRDRSSQEINAAKENVSNWNVLKSIHSSALRRRLYLAWR